MKKSREDIQNYIDQLKKQGIKANTSAPPFFRLMWSFGIGIRPPLNQSFLKNALLMGLFFGIFWGLFMWFFQWRKWYTGVFSAILFAAAAGLFFGVSMASYYRWKSRRVNVPTW
jgi:hypothetical protein